MVKKLEELVDINQHLVLKCMVFVKDSHVNNVIRNQDVKKQKLVVKRFLKELVDMVTI